MGIHLPVRRSTRSAAGTIPLPAGRPAARTRASRSERRSFRTSLVLVAPAVVLTAVFLLYPVFETVRISFFDWDGLTAPTFVGFAQFAELFQDPVFYVALRNNALFAVLVTTLTVGIGLYLAIVLNRQVRGWRFYRFVFYLPNVLPGTIIAIMWANAFDPNYGWLNQWLVSLFHLPGGGLLANPQTAIYVICFTAVWHVAGFPMILILGGLQSIPKEVLEAAAIDGANGFRTAWSISIPLIKDVLATVTLLQLIFSFKVFDTVQALTRGGPGTSTQVFGTLIYREAFTHGNFGYASALAVVASAIIIAVSLLYLIVLRPAKIEKAG